MSFLWTCWGNASPERVLVVLRRVRRSSDPLFPSLIRAAFENAKQVAGWKARGRLAGRSVSQVETVRGSGARRAARTLQRWRAAADNSLSSAVLTAPSFREVWSEREKTAWRSKAWWENGCFSRADSRKWSFWNVLEETATCCLIPEESGRSKSEDQQLWVTHEGRAKRCN